MKSTFYNEEKTKKNLCEFITNSEKLSMGIKCKEFEENFSDYQGRKYSVLFNSGSSANLALIQSLINIGMLNKGDKIGFSALTWATNVMPLMMLGLEPVPIDVELKNLNVGSTTLMKILERTPIKALFLTNVLGFCADIDNVKEICSEKNILLLEDNCESLGSKFKEKNLGNFGIASSFSFFVGHHISTIEGGMVCTDDDEIYRMLRMVRAHGWSRDLEDEKQRKLRNKHSVPDFFDRYTFYELGYNLRPTEITGFIGIEQMKYIEEIHNKRSDNFDKFNLAAEKNPHIFGLDLSHMSFISNFAYPLIFKNEEKFREYKEAFEKTVEIRPIIAGSIVEQPFFANYMIKNSISFDCPNAKKIHLSGFYFPNNPELTESEIEHIIYLLNSNM